MYVNLGSFEFYIGSDYVIRPERRKFRRFETTVAVSGTITKEGIVFGYLVIISYPGVPWAITGGTDNIRGNQNYERATTEDQ